MEFVEKAADASEIPIAAFVRTAAVRRAVDVLNAQGAQQALYPVAHTIVNHLLNPEVELGFVDHGEYLDYKKMDGWNLETGDDPNDRPVHCNPTGPDSATLAQAREALQTCGTEFVRLLLECWAAAEADARNYTPKFILNGSLAMPASAPSELPRPRAPRPSAKRS